MSGESIIYALLGGLLIGFLATVIMGGSFGPIKCIVLGLIGSAVGNYLSVWSGYSIGGSLGSILTGIIGSCVVLLVARLLAR